LYIGTHAGLETLVDNFYFVKLSSIAITALQNSLSCNEHKNLDFEFQTGGVNIPYNISTNEEVILQ
jgi:hypothetical protein